MTRSIDSSILNQLIDSDDAPLLLDVRRKADFDDAPRTIPGAVWRDPEAVDAWAADLSEGQPTVVFCVKGGSVSRSVSERLQKKGIEAVFLEGGLKAWIDSGRPVSEA